jgi:hypothetical protein
MGAEKPSIFEQLDALSRTRPLTPLEALRLERALRGSERKNEHWYWSRADVLRLRRHLLNGKKPKEIAVMMKRTERSVWRRMNMLGWTVRDASIWVINPTEAP